jgi:hypothetical protein
MTNGKNVLVCRYFIKLAITKYPTMNEITVETRVAGQLTKSSVDMSLAVKAADPNTAGIASKKE